MLSKPHAPNEEFFISFARSWFKSIAGGDWQGAFARLDLPPQFGEPFTPERFRREIEDDHFCEGTVFREQHPGPIVYADPDSIGASKYTSLYPLRGADDSESDDSEAEFAQCLRGGRSVELEHPVPLNGEWSDLTACFQFIDRGDSYAVRLDWLHVL